MESGKDLGQAGARRQSRTGQGVGRTHQLSFPPLCIFPNRPLLHLLDNLTAGDALIVAPWPVANRPADATALSHFESLKGLVRAVRNARAEYGVEEKRKVAATLVVEDEGLRAALTAELQVGQPCMSACWELNGDARSCWGGGGRWGHHAPPIRLLVLAGRFPCTCKKARRKERTLSFCLANGGGKELLEHTCIQISPNCTLVQSIALQTSLPFSRPDTPAASTPLLQSIALLAPVQSALPSSLPYMPSCLHPLTLHRTLLLSHPLTHLLPPRPCSPSPCWPAWSLARCPSCRQRPRQAAATAAASAWWCRTACRWEKCGEVLQMVGDADTYFCTHLRVTESIATLYTCIEALVPACKPRICP